MNLKKRASLIMAVVAVVSLIGAILLLAIALPRANATYKRVLEIVIAILLIVLSALFAYYLWLTRDAEPNFFLFDRAKKRNVPLEELSFSMVNERMNIYLSMVSETFEGLWEENALEREIKQGPRRVYRPLLAYKMLYDLADKNVDAYWALLLNAKPELVDSLCSALEQGGEQEMVKAFRFIMNNYRQSPAKIKDFVSGNLRYIRGRMLSYIKRNIEYFY